MNCHKVSSLPGLNFQERLRKNHHVPQSFYYQNGHRIFRDASVGIGSEPLEETYKDFSQPNEPIEYDPALTYGRTRVQQVEPFRPHFVVYDKKTLKFVGYFRQHVPDSHTEHYRTRYVNIFYFLEDDTITVIEPNIKNCGLQQGKIVRRGKISKKSSQNFYSWKDFNIGSDVQLNGINFHISDCDEFTRDFLMANGIEVMARETLPADPFTVDNMIKRAQSEQSVQGRRKSASDDKLRRFLEYSGLVLKFDCVLDETDSPGGDLISFKLLYYLEDDTICIKELPENQQGRDHFPKLLKRTKIPKNPLKKPSNFPTVALETTDIEIEEFYQPKDFMVGNTIIVFGRKFLLLDCDKFTRTYYDKVLRSSQPNKLEVQKPPIPEIKIKLPKYMGIGTPEDSLASCYHLRPKAPRRDVITYLVNANKSLRYGCQMCSPHPEEQDRKFILSYNLSDGTIKIIELPTPNSGIVSGKFLSSRKIALPDTNPNKPEYYSPKDFYIGAIVKAFAKRFLITSADLYVYRYMQAHPELFSSEAIENVRMYHLKQDNLNGDLRRAIDEDHQRYMAEMLDNKMKIAESAEDGTEAGATKISSMTAAKDRLPVPFVGEDEVKKEYHEKLKSSLIPCNIDEKQEENIPSEKGVVRFLEPHENGNSSHKKNFEEGWGGMY